MVGIYIWQVVRYYRIYTQQKTVWHWYVTECQAVSVPACKF